MPNFACVLFAAYCPRQLLRLRHRHSRRFPSQPPKHQPAKSKGKNGRAKCRKHASRIALRSNFPLRVKRHGAQAARSCPAHARAGSPAKTLLSLPGRPISAPERFLHAPSYQKQNFSEDLGSFAGLRSWILGGPGNQSPGCPLFILYATYKGMAARIWPFAFIPSFSSHQPFRLFIVLSFL